VVIRGLKIAPIWARTMSILARMLLILFSLASCETVNVTTARNMPTAKLCDFLGPNWIILQSERDAIFAELEARGENCQGGYIVRKPPRSARPEQREQLAKNFPSNTINVQFLSPKLRPDDVAVIVGNADYKNGKDIPNVTPAYADAEGMRRYVRQALGIADDNIIFLKDATQTDLIGTFGSKDNHKGRLFRYLTKGQSRVYIFYSGHGAPGVDGNYLVPTDAEASLIDLNGYPLKTLYQNLSKLPAKSVTVVLEACFSGASEAGSVINNASPVYLKAKDTGIPPNITVIAAGAANQIASWEQDKSHGLFTKYFLKGMSGEADEDKDRKVSWAELKGYLGRTMTRLAMRYYGRQQEAQIVVGGGGG
jgi:hypothetical protein